MFPKCSFDIDLVLGTHRIQWLKLSEEKLANVLTKGSWIFVTNESM